jgi:hypothetical protein
MSQFLMLLVLSLLEAGLDLCVVIGQGADKIDFDAMGVRVRSSYAGGFSFRFIACPLPAKLFEALFHERFVKRVSQFWLTLFCCPYCQSGTRLVVRPSIPVTTSNYATCLFPTRTNFSTVRFLNSSVKWV